MKQKNSDLFTYTEFKQRFFPKLNHESDEDCSNNDSPMDIIKKSNHLLNQSKNNKTKKKLQ
jgi:hypothetical protein